MKAQSSIAGQITMIALAANQVEREALQSYQVILAAFGPEVAFVFLVRASPAQLDQDTVAAIQLTWEEMLAATARDPQDNPLIIIPSTEPNISRWIQDPFAVLTDAGGRMTLLQPRRDGGPQEYALAIAKALGWELAMSDVVFEGGNVLVVGDHLLVGKDTLDRQGTGYALAEAALGEALRRSFGTAQVLLLGSPERRQVAYARPACYQPFFHLDLFLCPAGVDAQGRDTMLLAELHDAYIVGTQQPRAWRDLADNLRLALEDVRGQLLAAGFAVERMPIVLATNRQGYDVYSFHNLKVEAHGGGKRAILPEYSLQKSDAAEDAALRQALWAAFKECQQKLEDLGFAVVPLPSELLRIASKHRGSLHCMAKALKRR
jgi:hypothetical protein